MSIYTFIKWSTIYLGMTIDIDKVKDQGTISMPGYIDKVLKQFQTIVRK
jgi:hypothetical protein